MTKVAIKNENNTSFGGIYHIMDVFQGWALKNLPNPCWADADAAARHSAMEASWALSSSATFVVENALRTSMRLQVHYMRGHFSYSFKGRTGVVH